MRYAITDQTGGVLGSMVERCRSPLGPEPTLPDRMSFEAILSWARVGCPWRDLPGDFGGGSAVSLRLRRWIASGRRERLARRGGIAGKVAAHGATTLFVAVTSVLFFDGVSKIFPFVYARRSPLP